MLKWFFRRRIDAFEQAWGYDSAYLREMLEASPRGFAKLSLLQPLMRHREDAPAAAVAAAKIAATAAADCGPCLELAIRMARRAGLPAPLVDAIVRGDEAAMSDEARLGYAFAGAVVARDAGEAARLRGRIVHLWGRRALVTLATTIATAGIYPSLRYALGRGRKVGGLAAAVRTAKAA
jgi:alkylhydroperoxidase family enzyme